MRLKINADSINLWLSGDDTYDWAKTPGARWPCSQLSGRRLFAQFDSNGLCDLSIDGGKGEQDIDATEFNAIASDFLAGKVPENHPAYFVTVGQFK